MEFKNYWGTGDDSQDDLKYTDNIHRIMEEQCKYLFQYTNGKIFAVFGEIKIDGSVSAVIKAMSNAFKGVSGIPVLQETVAELSTKNLIDAKIDDNNYELAIVSNCIEDWFMPEVADFSKLKLMQSIDSIIEKVDFAELSKSYDSFAKVVEFLQK